MHTPRRTTALQGGAPTGLWPQVTRSTWLQLWKGSSERGSYNYSHNRKRALSREGAAEPRELHHLSQLDTQVLAETCKRLYSEQYKVPLGCTYIYTYIYTEVEYCIRIFAVRSL